MPKVSIILPVRNAEAYLAESLRSILDQSFVDFELLVIDASTDKSPEIVNSFRDDRIRFYHQSEKQGSGLVETLNQGIELSTGEYIARMDADDICLPERLERQAEFLDRNPNIGLVSSNIVFMSQAKKFLRTSNQPSSHEEIANKLRVGRCPIYHPTVMARREILRAFGGYRTAFQRAEDFDLWLRMLDEVQFCILKEPLLLYRLHSTQVSDTHISWFFTIMALADYYRVRSRKPSLVNSSGQWDPKQYPIAYEYFKTALLPRMALCLGLRKSRFFSDHSFILKDITFPALMLALRRLKYMKQLFLKIPEDLKLIIDLA